MLQSVSIRGNAVGHVLLADIHQIFVNNGNRNAEFLYTFPIPADASVCSFSAKTARNTFKGILEGREAALTKYKDAIAGGDSAYMLESHRDNIFQVSLGNVDINETVEVNISYMQDLKIADNELRLVIPTLVGVRYIPGFPKGKQTGTGIVPPTDQVPDADFITPVRGETGYRAEIEVRLTLENEIHSIASPSHKITSEISRETAVIRLAGAVKMDSDFVVNISLTSAVHDTCLSAEADGEYFSYVSFTPQVSSNTARRQKEFLFLIDISGSMHGDNIESAKRALKLCLRNMMDGDVFNIIAFESRFNAFAEKSVPYNTVNFERADQWVGKLYAQGGTEMAQAMRYAVENAVRSQEWESVMLLLTDGQIGNEDAVLSYMKTYYNGRVFTLGIDRNVNDSFLNKLAEVCRGFTEFYYPGGGEDLDKKVVKQFLRTDAAMLDNISIPAGCELAGDHPNALYSGECFRMILKSKQRIDPVEISGKIETETKTMRFSPADAGADGMLLRKMWARQAIGRLEKGLMDISKRHLDRAMERIVEVSKTYGVLCRHTSFVAVEERDEKFKQFPAATNIAVEVPGNSRGLSAGMAMPPMPSAAPDFAPMAFMVNSKPAALRSPLFFKNKAKPATGFPGNNARSEYEPEHTAGSYAAKRDWHVNAWNINSLYQHMQGLGANLDAFCNKSLRGILTDLLKGRIDYEADFFQLDWILSKAWDLFKDAQWRTLREELLAGLSRVGLTKYGTAQIAAEQRMDGSFGYCGGLKKQITVLALSRMINDDRYLYGRQIQKAFAWAGTVDWSDLPEEKGKLDELMGQSAF